MRERCIYEGKEKAPIAGGLEFGALGEIRTPYPLVRSQVLYPDELRARRGQDYSTGLCPKTRAARYNHWLTVFAKEIDCIMEAEQLNSLANHLEDLAERANGLRRYL